MLGTVFKPGRVSISDARLKGYDDISITSVKSLHSALASINYFRSQVPNFSELAGPLLEVIKSKKFKWGKAESDAWASLIATLKANSTVHIYKPDKPVVLSTDASATAAAAIITQSCHGRQRLIAASSRTFTSSERSASIFQKEVLAVIYGFSAYDLILRNATSITLEIDSKALLFLKYARDSNAHLTRLSLLISEFGVVRIIHVPSKCHIPADNLSRCNEEVKKFKNLLDRRAPMSVREAEQLVHHIAIKKGTVFDSSSENNIKDLLEGDSLPSVITPKNKSQRQLPSKQSFPVLPARKRERTIRPPPGTRARFAVNSKLRKPLFVKELMRARQAQEKILKDTQAHRDKREFAIEPPGGLNAITRSAARASEQKQQIHPEQTSSVQVEPPSEIRSAPEELDGPALENTGEMSQGGEPQPQTYESVRFNSRIISDGQITLKLLARLQREDPTLGDIYKAIEGPSPPRLFAIKNKILFHVKDMQNPRLCILEILLETVIRQHHNTVFATHMTITALLRVLTTKYWHPHLEKKARALCEKCLICAVTHTVPFREGSLGVLPASCKRSIFYCDLTLIGEGTYAFIAVDSYSLYTHIQAIPSKSENSIYKAILLLYTGFTC